MRSTNTWSPMSSVFSIELDGISNACKLNVMIKSPTTSTDAIEAMNSSVDSFFLSRFRDLPERSSRSRVPEARRFSGVVCLVAKSGPWKGLRIGLGRSRSAHNVHGPMPARNLQHVIKHVGQLGKFII